MKIEDYEKVCPICNGDCGYTSNYSGEIYFKCKFCNGKGKIDWINEIKIIRKFKYRNNVRTNNED